MAALRTFFTDPNALWVLGGTTLLGVSSGAIGSFAFLRKRGLMGDVLAHAALPGICIAFMLTGLKHPLVFLVGAIATGILASLSINGILRHSRIKEDTALALVLSVFFGAGIVLLTLIQQSGAGNQSGLDKFLFGQAASLVDEDLAVMGGVSALLLLICALFFKELKLLCFDAAFGRSLGFPMGAIDLLLMTMLVIGVVIGLQAAGVVLMAALIITPAAAARYWTDRLDRMVILSALLGGASGALGTVISTFSLHLPTGPLIVLAATAVFLFSLVFAPRRGLLAKALNLAKNRARTARENLLRTLYEEGERTGENRFSIAELETVLALSRRRLAATLRALAKKGWIEFPSDTEVALTEKGLQAAYDIVLRWRMVEMWHMHESRLGSPGADVDYLTERIPVEIFNQLWDLLAAHGRLPKWQPLEPEMKGGRTG
jgi:manganese/zinc/iron transport system permease protein